MRRILFLLAFIIFSSSSFSQVQTKQRKVVQILEPREVFINSATNIGGKTRVYYEINLPTNTVEWYYIYTTTPNVSGRNLDLFQQVSSLFSTNPFLNILVSTLNVDTGIYPLDVFLMNNKGLNEFNQKDFFGSYDFSRPSHFPEGTILNSKDGKVKVSNIKNGRYYLGLRNPSLNTGISVKIEVVAVVEEIVVDDSKWSKQIKETLYSQFLLELKKQNFSDEKNQRCVNCMMAKITKEYTPKDFFELANYEVVELLKKYNLECNL